MQPAMIFGFRDELQKIAAFRFKKNSGVMEDMHREYQSLLQKHISNPAVLPKLHPTEQLGALLQKSKTLQTVAPRR